MADPEKKEREVLTNSEQIELRRAGTSDVLRVPSSWRHALPQLQGPIMFDAHVEKDGDGRIFLVFEKVRKALEVKKKP